MHNTDDLDSAWDNLDSEFGLEPDTKKAKPELREQAPPPVSKLVDETPIADEDEPELHSGALFDPGPEHILEDTDHVNAGVTEDEFDDESSELFDTEAAPAGEGGETPEGGEGGEGKRKRKRRRRKKKKPGDPTATPGEAAAVDDAGDVAEAIVPDDETVVEEGEAPSELVGDDDDDDAPPTSAVDEELVATANQPKQEWNVMTWADLIGKLHRPS